NLTGAKPTPNLHTHGLLNRLHASANFFSLLIDTQAFQRTTVDSSVTHELPVTPLHLIDSLWIEFANRRIQCHRRLNPCCIEDVGNTPESYPHAVFACSEIDDIRTISSRRQHCGVHTGIE